MQHSKERMASLTKAHHQVTSPIGIQQKNNAVEWCWKEIHKFELQRGVVYILYMVDYGSILASVFKYQYKVCPRWAQLLKS